MKASIQSHKTSKIHIKKGDLVKLISGKIVDGKNTGKVLRVYPKTYRALVEGLNIISRHTKPSASSPEGGIIEREGPIHISNVRLVESTAAAKPAGKSKKK